MAFREQLLVTGCGFTGEITADFGDKIYRFVLECTASPEGSLTFAVTEPVEIAGIGGTVHAGKGKLEYAGTILAFPLLADGTLSPVSAPWILIHGLRSGYLSSAGKDGERMHLTVYDSYEEDALELDVWFDSENTPVYTEFLWQGRRVLSMEIKDFRFV